MPKEPESWDWEALYKRLEDWMGLLISPSEEIKSFHESVESCKRVENSAILLYTRISRHVALAKKRLADAKLEKELKIKQLLQAIDSPLSFSYKKLIAEANATEEQHRLDSAEDLHTRLTVFLDCLNRVIQAANHNRADINKRIKILEIEYNLNAKE